LLEFGICHKVGVTETAKDTYITMIFTSMNVFDSMHQGWTGSTWE